ncbi:MAG: glycolate oxidase subunit GlcF [Pseudomonadota bacterium]
MQTNLSSDLLKTNYGQRADEILRKCVHCGFCNATCPTFILTGDELDGPRGRIYLIKEMLENNKTTKATATHLDRCLTCLSCETTCPSGVKFGELVEIGRHHLDKLKLSSFIDNFKRWLICNLFAYPKRLRPFYFIGQLSGLIPSSKSTYSFTPKPSNFNIEDKVILLEGCVQSVSNPEINQILRQLLMDLNIQSITEKHVQCCGAIHHHNGMTDKSLEIMKRNIDLWWPHIESGASAIVMTASGCGITIKDYARLLQDDNEYSEKAHQISQMTFDASEYLAKYKFNKTESKTSKILFHPPCTLQHGQRLNGIVENILTNAGYEIVDFNDKHICCGSAGSYSILQSDLALQLRNNKIQAIQKSNPDVIATANIGCLLHIQQGTSTKVRHWLELIKTNSQ